MSFISSQPITQVADWISQHLTSAPLWIQTPIVVAVVFALCAVLAVLWLSVVDYLGSRAFRLFNAGETEQVIPAMSLGKRVRADKQETRIVIHEDPR